jgi:hypothetical protein
VEELAMTSTTIRPDDKRIVTTDPAPAARRSTPPRVVSAVLVGVVAVAGASAGVSYAMTRLSFTENTTGADQVQGFGDARESAHGIRAGLASGTGVALETATAVTQDDRVVIAHGARGSITTADGRRILTRSGDR